jgi:hypothetical protein
MQVKRRGAGFDLDQTRRTWGKMPPIRNFSFLLMRPYQYLMMECAIIWRQPMALGSGYWKRNEVARETALFGASLTLVGVVGVSVAGGVNFLFLAIVSSAAVATAVIRVLFPQ